MVASARRADAGHGTGPSHRGVKDRLQDTVGGIARLRVIVLLAAVLALDAGDKAAVGATAAQLEQALHIGNTDIGLLVTASTFVTAVATLPLGALTDRVNRTRLLTGAVVVWSIAIAVSGASTSFTMLLITRLVLGLVLATSGPVVASLAGDLFPATERGRLYGFILSGELIGAGVGFLFAGDLAAALSWRYAFWLFAVLGFVLAVALRGLPEPARGGQSRLEVGATEIPSADDVAETGADGPDADTPDQAPPAHGDTARDDPAPDEGQVQDEIRDEHISPRPGLVLHTDPTERSLWWTVRYVLSIPTNRILIIGSALGYFFFSGVETFAILFVRERFDVGQGVASLLLVVVGVGAVAGVLVSGRFSDHLIDRGHITSRPLVAGLAFLFAAALFVPALLTTSLLVAAPLFFLGAAGIGGANPPLDAARLDLMHSRLWGRAEAVRTVLRSSFQAGAPLLFGYVSTLFGGHNSGLGHPTAAGGGGGLGPTFLIMLAPVVVAGLLILLRARRSYPRDVATAMATEEQTRTPEPSS